MKAYKHNNEQWNLPRKAKDLINWQELSRVLTGKADVIRSGNIPKKYQKNVCTLLEMIEAWKSEINK